MLGFAEHLSVFPIMFLKFNNSEGRMQESGYHMTLNLILLVLIAPKRQYIAFRKHEGFFYGRNRITLWTNLHI